MSESRIFDVHNHIGVELAAYVAGEFPYSQSLFDLQEAAQRNHVTHVVVFPMVSHLAQGSFGGDTLLSSQKTPYAWENRRMCEEIYGLFGARSQNVLPFAMFDPNREVEAQIRELRALASEYHVCGLKTQPTMIRSKITGLNGVGRPILELAGEWDVPLLIHSSILPADIWSQASDILDIAEKWPDLRFNVAHSCRFDLPSLERLASLSNCRFDVSAHGIHCELATQNSPVVAIPERRFASDYQRPEIVLRDLALKFPGKVLWGSDSPYHSFCAQIEGQRSELMSSFERETGFLWSLEKELVTEIAETNVLAWLGSDHV